MSQPANLVDRLGLIRTVGIGPIAYRQLLLAGRLDRHAGNKLSVSGA